VVSDWDDVVSAILFRKIRGRKRDSHLAVGDLFPRLDGESSALAAPAPVNIAKGQDKPDQIAAAGLEPARELPPKGFSYHYSFRYPEKIRFVVWTMPSPCTGEGV
jgi:hypothetical protein